MGATWESTLEGGGRANILGIFLPRGSAGGTLVWSRDMDDHGENDTEIRGSACEFLEEGHT